MILVERNFFKQNAAQYPISFPPNKTNFCGKNKVGINNIEIKKIPIKKNTENKIVLIILIKSYTKSLRLCRLLII